jgi:glycosyltransferase involved in cell wall biosynthesis
MRFVLLEPGFNDMSTHHANVNRQLYLATGKADITLAILASKIFTPSESPEVQEKAFQQSVVPWFTTPCYTNNLKPLSVSQEQVLAQQFCKELHAAHRDNFIQNTDTLIIHTCFSFHVLGLAAWLMDMKTAFSGKLIVCGMFYPGKRDLKTSEEYVYFEWYLRNRLAFILLDKARGQVPLKLATSCQQYVNAYQDCTSMTFTLHPAVNYIAPIVTTTKEGHVKRVILYIGSVKRDKGLDWLAETLPDLLVHINDIEFFIHFNEASPGVRDFLCLKEQLVNLANVHANLTLYFDPMSQNEYEYQLSSSDAVVLMYQPSSYQNKTSGLLWDAARYPNLAVICSKGIWAEQEYEAIGGSAFTFSYGNTQDLIASINTWKNTSASSLKLSGYGDKINQSFADWCFSSSHEYVTIAL